MGKLPLLTAPGSGTAVSGVGLSGRNRNALIDLETHWAFFLFIILPFLTQFQHLGFPVSLA